MKKAVGSILFCGDIMPGGVLPYQQRYVSTSVLNYLSSTDIRIGTLEAAIGDDFPYDTVKMADRCNIIYARKQDFWRVKDLDINVVSLANNHVFDLGYEGFLNTIKVLEENNVRYCGAGRNVEEASRPVVVTLSGKTIAIYACCMYGSKYIGYVPIASRNSYGVNPLDIDRVVRDIQSAVKKYDKVIVMPHWGKEYTPCPLEECVNMAYRMIDAGADAVIGSHTHSVQPVIKYRGKVIAFSLGNFLFPDFYMEPPRPIWYPDSLASVEQVESVIGYPFPIEKPLKQVWHPNARVGLTIKLTFDEKKKMNYKKLYTSLGKNNVLGILDATLGVKLKMWLFSRVVENKMLRHLYNFYLSFR